jgi:plastocyanin
MGPGRYRLVFLVMVGAMNAVPAPAATIQVTIDQIAYAPAEIQAKLGDTIEWINKDIVAHTATVRGDWDVMVLPNKSARLVVKKAGTFDYFCRFHPNMKGRMTVAPE